MKVLYDIQEHAPDDDGLKRFSLKSANIAGIMQERDPGRIRNLLQDVAIAFWKEQIVAFNGRVVEAHER